MQPTHLPAASSSPLAGSSLQPHEIEQFRTQGFLAPIRAISADTASAIVEKMLDLEHRHGFTMKEKRPHAVVPALNALVRDAGVLDAVQALIGPNILCWSSTFFAKPPLDDGIVAWHQDATYYNLSRPAALTAWIALTPSTPESGCMRVMPGSHLQRQQPHVQHFAANNMLTMGEEIACEVDASKAVDLVLQPGEMSLHDVLLVHGSERNRSALPRIGFAVRYVPTDVHQLDFARDPATLVRGLDEYGHYDLEPTPSCDLDPAVLDSYRASMKRRVSRLGPQSQGSKYWNYGAWSSTPGDRG